MKKEIEVPFGPPPEEYNYRCSLCQFEIGVNEAIIDVEIGLAKFKGRHSKSKLKTHNIMDN